MRTPAAAIAFVLALSLAAFSSGRAVAFPALGAAEAGTAARYEAALNQSDRAAAGSIGSLLQRVHGCHFDMGPGMSPDRANGPHYHNNQCAVIRTGPPQGQYRQRDYDEPRRGAGYGENERGGERRRRDRRGDEGYGYAPPPPQPICTEQCRYRGPFKSCKTVCQ